MQQRPVAHREREIDAAMSNLEEDLFGDFDLKSTVRNIDVNGVSADYGYNDIGGTTFRIVDVTFPFIMDDTATVAK